MSASHDQFYAAMLARDYRFDGKFFIGVKSTGIYCRPICPAKPKIENVEFFASCHEAEKAGYRPCLRCRPEAAPLSPAWYGRSAIVQRSLRAVIDLGLKELSEEQFAEKFGVTARHLRRLFVQEIGKTPKQFYQEQRLNLARNMIVETRLPITEIAFEAGFRSLRRFNEAFRNRFYKAPSDLRKTGTPGLKESSLTSLKLRYRPPFNWRSILTYLKRHQIDHIEEIGPDTYIRYFPTQKGMGRVLVENNPQKSCLVAHFDLFDCGQLYGLIQNTRRLFDLDADPLLISTQFEKSDILRNLNQRSPGGRAPGCWNGFESATGIILGQLVSSEQACGLVRQLVLQYGEAWKWRDKTVFIFPAAEKLAEAAFDRIPTTKKRKETLRIFSQEVVAGKISLNPHQDIRKLKEQLLAIPGIGPWTVETIGMRCLSDPDSCPRTDLILKRVQQSEPNLDLQRIRPWRAYAAHLLWEAYAGQLSKKKRGHQNGTLF
ncbi:MAG: DNA-3-methyladenine glycosylase 2 family protein [Deltaproteobacteria bacterium]|nr:DNA-3-methyladenine glycosylase 2 family protein [Deltaproteobacteria bacterium]